MKKKLRKTVALVMGMVMGSAVLWGGGSAPVLSAPLGEGQTRVIPDKPVYDAQTDTTDWDYVYFGSYPQTELSAEAVTAAIENASYDLYGDAEVDGQKYRRVRAASANYSSGIVTEGFYDWSDKDYAYFRYEPVRWRVLDVEEDALFLMADSVLDCRKYSSHDNAVEWSSCVVRNWLNGYDAYAESKLSFIYTAFTEEERNAICTTKVTGSDNLLHKVDGGADTHDKIFLLSVKELLKESYGFSPDFMKFSITRQLEPTGYAHANGLWMSSYNETYGRNCWWLLRTPGSYKQAVSLVYRFGNIYQDGYYADTPYYGICPALRLDIDSAEWTLEEKPTVHVLQADTEAIATAGDADGNGCVNLQDAQLVLKAALKITANANELVFCDVDGIPGIGLGDAQLILKYALKIIPEFPDTVIPEPSRKPQESPMVTPKVSEPVVSTEVPSQVPQVSEPASSEAPTKRPVRPELPSHAPVTVAPQNSKEPLVQGSYEPSGVIWIAGDSIAVEYHSSNDKEKSGWGEVLEEYFGEEVTIQNKAIGGRSSKSFTTESKYKEIRNGMQEGDYLFISFGHNDERASVDLYTDPYGDSSTERSFKWYLKEYYIDPAIRAGVQPVLLSPVARRYFYNGKLINPQLHTPYAKAMEELAAEYAQMGINVYYIDMHTEMLNLYEELGEAGTQKLHAVNDNTHLCRAGAVIVCENMVREMKKQNMSLVGFLK